ncbi:MAG: extracellular solute-binding protein [Planctomycetota bacterium]|nr:extracellular solute-binding protein [Planctomycetota bacterium]
MARARLVIAACFLVVLGLPMLVGRCTRSTDTAVDRDAPAIIVITPHVAQIRSEFARAFSEWHLRNYGTTARIDFRTVGGTSEIIRALEARFNAALAAGKYIRESDGTITMQPGAVDFDIMFGGGSYDHGGLKSGVVFQIDGEDIRVPISVPAGFSQDQLDEWFGDNTVGAGKLYDPDQYWIGNALSGFGIVYNRDLTRELLGRDDLDSFRDLTDPRLAGWVALADPRQSGSITTSMDAILSVFGWDEGWRTLRAAAANTRYFTNSSTKPPIDVSQGEAAAGLAIDFYGRSQSQVVMRPGETPETARVGYVDPPGEVSIDADPVSIIRGGPNPELARRFLEFTLSDEGQALWNFHATETPSGETNPMTAEGDQLGPRHFELRRMPIRRDFYARYREFLIDKVDPFEAASDTPPAGWRSAIGMMMGAFAVDNQHAIREAWVALRDARERGVDPAQIAEAEAVFFAFPTPEQVRRHWIERFGEADSADAVTLPDDALLFFTPENYRAIRNTWRNPAVQSRLKIVYARAFAENYHHVTSTLQAASDADPIH